MRTPSSTVIRTDPASRRALRAQRDAAARQHCVAQVVQRRGVRQVELLGPSRQREPRRFAGDTTTHTQLATAVAATVKPFAQRSGASGPDASLTTSLRAATPRLTPGQLVWLGSHRVVTPATSA